MSIYLNKLTIENLRSIHSNIPLKLDFSNINTTVLDGPNGYGKSTIFDAIELLISGKIEHFKKDIQNRGSVDLDQIANNKNKLTCITGEFKRKDGTCFNIIREIDWTKPETKRQTIKIDDNQQNEYVQFTGNLFELLGISKEIFEVGMYVSQSDSLKFLQNKYGNRKKILTSILGKEDLIEKKEYIKSIGNSFRELNKNYTKELQKRKEKLVKVITELEKFNNEDQKANNLYSKLFPDNNYDFDKKEFDLTTPYSLVIGDLPKIRDFLQKYPLFLEQKKYDELKSVVSIVKKEALLKAYFYRDEFPLLIEKSNYLEALKELAEKKEKKKIPKNNWIIMNQFPLEYDDLNAVDESLKKIEITKNKTSRKIDEILEKRVALKISHEHSDILKDQECPFCGKLVPDLEESYNVLTTSLKEKLSYEQQQIAELKAKKIKYSDAIWIEIEKKIENDASLLKIFVEVSSLLNTNTDEVKKIIPYKSLKNFKYNSSKSSQNSFIEFYDYLKNYFNGLLDDSKTHFNSNEFGLYNYIFKSFFNEKSPSITIENIDQKIGYIFGYYHDKNNIDLTENNIKLKKVNEQLAISTSVTLEKSKYLDGLSKIYEDSYTMYQTDIVKKIKIPLYIISGRILQTYQLGLGIKVNVKENQVFFEAGNVKGDIFNVLSLGQLNGVILSILIALRKTYIDSDGLNLLLIDDPLQSIDDISTHSFIDLLSEELGDTQILLSTHEDEKSNLIKYKFNQVGKASKNFNMQKIYLER
ncbi:ATP-binding protein [Carnobacterium maltaromaticum]|uniref:ATP-binding protein n=1 Tax=Carnobacterium maltaromaticum TaxID=2751 RepID=UPI0005526AC2|nr:ATP-binding protein [Carnobacterium maltaromaticum]AOA02041.1 hypothetical protein BFC23_05850 [Carnobacterium maltaromaticum]KRN64511.1 hypothetical protein IV70_GL002456 [Carnobacterium maltaromaticum DSM 20342]MCI1819744.1 ATP-binding protein [Carnobacterium maltaromaticum]